MVFFDPFFFSFPNFLSFLNSFPSPNSEKEIFKMESPDFLREHLGH